MEGNTRRLDHPAKKTKRVLWACYKKGLGKALIVEDNVLCLVSSRYMSSKQRERGKKENHGLDIRTWILELPFFLIVGLWLWYESHRLGIMVSEGPLVYH